VLPAARAAMDNTTMSLFMTCLFLTSD